MVDTNALSAPLRKAANAREVPGIVAAAGTADTVLFEARSACATCRPARR